MRWEKTEEPLSESYVYICYMLCLVTQSCPTCCDPMDCSLPKNISTSFGKRILGSGGHTG